jgi:nucleoside-diphosphate-sugar epimerase
MSELQTTIPKGSVVLVTGATGFVASHLTRQLLQRGYKIRGTVRDISKATWLTEKSFSPLATPENLELVAVPDLAVPHAFDEAVKGVSAIAHVATIANMEPEPKNIVPQTVGAVVGILEAAANEPSVKEFVYTSSIVAGTFPTVGNDTFVTRDTWNDATTKLAYAPPPYEPTQWFFSYAESKLASEKAVWKFAEEKKPHFNVNVVSPSGIFGEPLNEKHAGSAGDWISILFKGDMERLGQFSGGECEPVLMTLSDRHSRFLHPSVIILTFPPF